jgi:hypothetical protein
MVVVISGIIARCLSCLRHELRVQAVSEGSQWQTGLFSKKLTSFFSCLEVLCPGRDPRCCQSVQQSPLCPHSPGGHDLCARVRREEGQDLVLPPAPATPQPLLSPCEDSQGHREMGAVLWLSKGREGPLLAQ